MANKPEDAGIKMNTITLQDNLKPVKQNCHHVEVTVHTLIMNFLSNKLLSVGFLMSEVCDVVRIQSRAHF